MRWWTEIVRRKLLPHAWTALVLATAAASVYWAWRNGAPLTMTQHP